MRIILISCEVIYREACYAAARSPHQVDVRFLPKGLHDQGGPAMRSRLQSEIDEASERGCDAIVLGYGLCGNGTVGLTARAVPVIVPRAHDCITLLMGSRDSYQNYFENHSGVYYRSTGWLERGEDLIQLKTSGAQRRTGAGYQLDELIERYGEDNGRYLYEQLNSYQSSYTQLTFIRTGIEPNDCFERAAEQEAAARGWKYETFQGSLRWFETMLAGDWSNDDFLTVPPGYRVKERFDDRLLDIEKVD